MPLPSANRLNLAQVGKLHFQEMDVERFRCLKLAYEAGKIGGTMPTVLNAANEVAVAAFLEGKIHFLQIDDLIEKALSIHQMIDHPSLTTIQEVDKETRQYVSSLL
jgi:1-deoxy-D-xylulose-5-phosphate reductoisomerase